jgi:uncharacterized protein
VRIRAAMDTGPLVAYFCEREAHHAWAVDQFETFALPILTCEPVLTETCFLLQRANVPASRLLEKVRPGVLQIGISVENEASAVADLMRRYRNLPMSLADACLVRLAEISGLPICTLDSDFGIYRGHRRTHLRLISPS